MQEQRKRTAVVLIGNEILSGAVKRVLGGMGYEIRGDITSAVDADFAVIGAYFLLLGVANQLYSVNPSLPLVLLHAPLYPLGRHGKHFFGVIELAGHSEMEACEKISEWFTDGPGLVLSKKRTIQ